MYYNYLSNLSYLFVTNVTILLLTDSLEQVTRFLPVAGAVCAETCRRDLINNIYIYMYMYIHIQLYVCV